jgi:hypothetical protein
MDYTASVLLWAAGFFYCVGGTLLLVGFIKRIWQDHARRKK